MLTEGFKKKIFYFIEALYSRPLCLNVMVSSDQDELLSVGCWNSTVKLKPNYVLISCFFIGPII